MIDLIEKAIELAENDTSKLSLDVLKISGMSSPKVRHFLNNLINEDSSYLEVGCWRGSTFCSALHNNNPKYALGIDNWSQFTDPTMYIYQGVYDNYVAPPKRQAHVNAALYINCDYNLVDCDCFEFPHALIKEEINTYFYDGDHSYDAQYQALTYFSPCFSDRFILIVDDWNMEDARRGTEDAIKELNLNVLYKRELPAKFNGDLELWWNGLGVFYLE